MCYQVLCHITKIVSSLKINLLLWYFAVCPPGQKHVNCPAQLCNYAGCPDKPQESLRCVVESCGKCSVKFINKTTGQTVKCGPGKWLSKHYLFTGMVTSHMYVFVSLFTPSENVLFQKILVPLPVLI